ncbi:hypothetical protein GGX14DRAFT_673228 [Mycena pura]|uniref:Uncharacterized protein n=1 Tax=Mycena pura TaxID=153505 RepID=A0AAD6Y8K2_9AGAR|nr:hypothetical protein GGX14DRAFT_673228 [Mycena pura]
MNQGSRPLTCAPAQQIYLQNRSHRCACVDDALDSTFCDGLGLSLSASRDFWHPAGALTRAHLKLQEGIIQQWRPTISGRNATLALLPVDTASVASRAPRLPPFPPRRSQPTSVAHRNSRMPTSSDAPSARGERSPPATSPPSPTCACGVQHHPASMHDARASAYKAHHQSDQQLRRPLCIAAPLAASPHAATFLSADPPPARSAVALCALAATSRRPLPLRRVLLHPFAQHHAQHRGYARLRDIW